MKLKSVQKIENKSNRYDIQTESNNFFANGILVHNSTLIVSKYKGQYILRTRGTLDAKQLTNGYELEEFKKNVLPQLEFANENGDGVDTWNYSYLFEWVSPVNKIVLNYGDSPDWFLIGIVRHQDYNLFTQDSLGAFASYYGLKRPSVYKFPTIEQLLKDVADWKGKEGVVIYSNRDQMLHKVKALDYLLKHRFKSEATLENTLELYFSYGQPSYQEFETKLVETFDYECFEMVRGYASQICDASKDVKKIVDGMNEFVTNKLRVLPTRKDQAQLILSSYGNTNRNSFVFALLDNKPLNDDQMKKLFWQCLKK
jgi:hypothetical protein